jgi:hypothetical protein
MLELLASSLHVLDLVFLHRGHVAGMLHRAHSLAALVLEVFDLHLSLDRQNCSRADVFPSDRTVVRISA